MTIGTKVKFTYRNKIGVQQEITLTLSNDIVSENVMSNETVYAKLSSLNRQHPMETLLGNGYMFAARNLLKREPYATDIAIYEVKETNAGKSSSPAGALILAIMAIVDMVKTLIKAAKDKKKKEENQEEADKADEEKDKDINKGTDKE